ncbi:MULTISPECIES: DUF6571 family protein [unclassified Streptomyces]|uniref:DUF6571 family protein n=1 Tax=unclassified Streptomyces TaxID=2593676 RepID=UPI0006AF3E18|nr:MULTISPECIES: DUF6571 family protein [unclassified Streptomyces]KOX26003.1 hypothetical protein ADL06_17035 [Streptomyces sp. NRRL F-6491]KOX42433.1 hypothetical protein ADL08_15785 [Streptomyces sp. NRRL F-6492]
MDFEALHSANFKLLDDTVSDWTSMLTKLQSLKKDAHDGLQGKALKADWAGDNAVIGREFVGKTAGEFGDALTQATSIRDIMLDTRDELKTQQRLLKEAVERGRGKNLTVTASGGGFTVRENPDKKAPNGQSDVDGLRDELQGILNTATEIDSSAATSLKALVDLTDHGFSDAVYKDRDSAANAVKEAEKLAAIAKKKPEDLTPADFDALNAGLGKYSGDPIFAEHFATTLGPKGTLDFWAGLNDPHLAYKVGRERVEQYDDLQKNLSLTLATATQADTPEMSRWKYDMVNTADQPLSKNSTTFGAQVMSNLMRWGNFDDQFLKDYGTKLIDTEKKMSDNGRHMPVGWQHMGMDPLLNRTGTDSGSDPMTGFLKALANSPDAATDFFNADFVTKDEDHDFEEDADGNGKNEKRELSNFDYLFEERDWPQDRDDKGKDSTEGRNNLAMALEAATTGHPAGEMPTVNTPPHNKDQAELMQKVVSSISDDPERLTKHSYMTDSVGQMASEYLPDINRAVSDDSRGNTEKLFPIAGTPAALDHSDVTRFLVTVGQDPKGNAAVEIGQAKYMADLMDYQLNPNTPADMKYPHSPQDTIEEISRRSAEIGGTLAVGRQEAIVGPAAKEAKDFADSVAQQKNAWSGAIGTGIGVGVSFVATPVGGAVASGVAGTVSSVVLEHIFQQSETDVLKDAGKSAGDLWQDSKKKNVDMSQIAAIEAAKAHGLPDADRVADWARTGTSDGFSDASDNARHMADDLETEIQPD